MNDDSYRQMQERLDGEVRELFERNVKNCANDCQHVKNAVTILANGKDYYSKNELWRFVQSVAGECRG